MKIPTRFIVIDDDIINNMLCTYVIQNTQHEIEIQTFDKPEEGFEYIVNEYSKTGNEIPTVLLLDINMPKWSGWDFIDNFEKLDEQIKKQIKIYMLSSSVDQKDLERAKENKNVADYLVKPLKHESVLKIVMSYSSAAAV